MILALLLLPILVITANPFHKYPYVFLLDVGNEELEKVNTEQIRLSSPGGSVAIRHPAIGNGDDIAHVRVSGIDFGTDIKANIVDGGPGYKYIVIVLMGNPGVAFDALITIQTVPSAVNDDSLQTIEDNNNSRDNSPSASQLSEEDLNNSAEDLNDSVESEETDQNGVNEKNGELRQESSNVYSYAQKEALSGYESEYNDERSDSDEEENDNKDDINNISKLADIDESYNEDSEQRKNVEVEEYDASDGDLIYQRSAERYDSNDDDIQSDEPILVDQNLNDKYLLRDHLYNDAEVYPQESIQEDSDEYNDYQNNYRLVDINEVYDDYEEDPGKYRDVNNNFIDTDDASAVAY